MSEGQIVTSEKMGVPELKQWVLRRFGAPLVEVELTEDHLQDAVEDACRWFAAKKGWKKRARLIASAPEIPLPADCDTVLDVTFTNNTANSLDQFVDPMALVDGIPGNLFGGSTFGGLPGNVYNGQTGGMLSSYTQLSQYLHMARRVLGTDGDWIQLPGGKTLWLAPSDGSVVEITYKATSYNPKHLNEMDHEILKRRIMANAKITLGRIRSKFDSFPTAQGAVQLDGPVLLQEGQAEIEGLDEEIKKIAFPIPFLRG